jgi:hypothetical protein
MANLLLFPLAFRIPEMLLEPEEIGFKVMVTEGGDRVGTNSTN